MALSGIQIYKFLPKTNCKKCGFPTCLAFAMKLASREVELSLCPDISEEGKAALETASRPPIRLVTIGSDSKKVEVGNEVVMFRHEKTFFHQPGLVLRISDTEPQEVVTSRVSEVAAYSVERVGLQLSLDGFAIQNKSKEAASFVSCIETVRAKTDLPLVLISDDPGAMGAGLDKTAKSKPLIYAATSDNWDKMAELSKQYQCPLAVYEPQGLTELAGLVEQVNKAGVEDIVLDPGARGFVDSLSLFTQLRRLALRKSFSLLGYPLISFPGEGAETLAEEATLCAQHIAKYSGIIVLDHFSPAMAYPLLTLRLNIYTDPQKPMRLEAGIYPINEPKADSPLMVSTNFSLTYFSISGEVESSRWPVWLVICDTEGLSVLTAWSAGKFDAERIAKAVKQFAADKVSHQRLIIPGRVSVLRGELEEELPGWEIMVGPPEAMGIGPYLKQRWAG